MRSPIPWFGGKGNMVKKLLPLITKHHTYVEVFGGGASLLFAKPPSPVEVYNDLDGGLVNLFRVLRDPDQFEQLHFLASMTPYAREEYNFCRETWQECNDPVTRAYRFFVVARMSFSGAFAQSFSSVITASNRGMAGTVSKWLSTIDGLPEVHARLMRVQIERQDFRTIIERYDSPATLFYCDPPYISTTRKGGKYNHEMSEQDHENLVGSLLKIQGKAIVSGYAHPIYNPFTENGWRRKDFATACYAVGRTKATRVQGEGAALSKHSRIETVWISGNDDFERSILW